MCEDESILADPARLGRLRKTGLLNRPSQHGFDRITRLTARVLGVPIALVSLVEKNRQVFAGCAGLAEPWSSLRECPISDPFCRLAVVAGEPLVVEDTREHPLLRESTALAELGGIAYAGIPLMASDGLVLGTLCAIDTERRTWSAADIGTLADLAASVMAEIELRAEVNARRKSESRLRRSERRFRSLTEHSSDVVAILDPEGVSRYDSASVTGVLGYGKNERLGRNAFELVYPEDLPEVLVAFQGVLDDPEHPRRAEFRYRHKDGSWRWMEAIGTNRLSDPAVRGIVINSRDVTSRKEAEQQLRESEERFRMLVEQTAIGIVLVDMQGRPVESNPAMERILGYSGAELRAMTFTEFTHPEEGQAAETLFEELARGERDHHTLDKHYVRKDGSLLWGRLTLSVLRDTAGQPQYVIGMVEDLSEHIRAEALAHEVKMLKGLLPICMYCKRIRNDEKQWELFEEYISSRSEAEFTHRVCPACVERHYDTFMQ